jgi:hypothetical protein
MEHTENNYEFLVRDLKYLGFDSTLNADLKEMLATEADSFELEYRGDVQEEPIEAVLYFHRPSPEGYFFFSKYILSASGRKHSFFVFKGRGVTVKEGFNLLNGRAVFKQRVAKNGQTYNEWIDLDLTIREDNGFKPRIYPESYGFDLSALIDSLMIDTPTANWDRSMLVRSLEKGNLQTAFIRQDGMQRKVYIQASPRERTITIHELESPACVRFESKTNDDIEDLVSNGKPKTKKLKDAAP